MTLKGKGLNIVRVVSTWYTGTKEIPLCADEFKAGEENRIAYESL